MQRLSRPIEELREHYGVVVVGSGYGGSIAASRLARAGQDVCLLERGREIHPGSYPIDTLTALPEMQARTTLGHVGSPTAMLDFRLDGDVAVVVGCGLGGTSLINANVALRPAPEVFDGDWPRELRSRGDARVLDPDFERAEHMLGSNPYPDDWPELPKMRSLERSAEAFGTEARKPRINVTFGTGPNAAGVEQQACTLCGDCVSGCNYGAKNTVLMNYLPDAVKNGAQVFTSCSVRTVHRRHDGTWLVEYQVVGEGRERYPAPAQTLTADVVVLAAGTLGSTEILLRSRAAGLRVSRKLGERFSGNGDVLGFAYDTDSSVRAVGRGWRPPPDAEEAIGPCITGMIDLRDDPRPPRQLIIEDGVAPGPLAPILPGTLWATAFAAGQDRRSALEQLWRLVLEAAQLPLGSYRGPIDRTLTYLVMSTDTGHGHVALENDWATVRWPGAGDETVIRNDNGRLRHAAGAVQGTFVPDPLSAFTRDHKLVTVHPLGGAVMGDDAEHGVVDHKGRVFAGPTGTDVHDGLYVLDGSIVPTPLDVNPLLTISALAERAVRLLAEDRGWTIDDSPPEPGAWTSAIPGRDEPVTRAGLRFTERMSGHFSTEVKRSYAAGDAQGRADASTIEFVVTTRYDDLDALLADTATPARMTGTVVAPVLSPYPLQIADGEFRMIVPEPRFVETWTMRYRMDLRSREGRTFRFEGFKVMHERPGLNAWPDTTTLYVTVRDDAGGVLGRGRMRITMPDFLRLLRTMTVTGVPNPRQRRWYHRRFLKLFAGKLLKIYGGPLDEAGRFPHAPSDTPVPPPLRPTPLPANPPVRWRDPAGWHDGTRLGEDAFLRLTRYEGGEKGPLLLAPGFGMSALSYTSTTIEKNLAEYLFEHGYDVWLFDYRAGIDLPSSKDQFTIDDVAVVDWPAAVGEVLRATGKTSVQAFGHCVGSVSLMMAVLAGMGGVRSAVCSQFTVDISTSWFNRLKADLHVSEVLGRLGLRRAHPLPKFNLPDALLDVVLRVLPMATEERCGQAVCRWINAIYGCTHRHAQLNQATHEALNTMFGVGNVTSFNHLAEMVRKGRAVNRDGADVYTSHPERMAIPTLFLQGRHNYIFYRAGSARTVRWLRRHNDPALYERRVLAKYAHLDGIQGRNAWREVYPIVLEHLEKTAVV